MIAPFRPFPPESALHQEMAAFDWLEALQMCCHSARVATHMPVSALTDLETALPVDALRVPTTSSRLMLWTLEACALYLEQAADRSTVMLDVDQLIFGDLGRWFQPGVDLTVLIRPDEKHLGGELGQPLLNGVQWWAKRSRRKLARFYRAALALAAQLPEDRQVWGADTDAVRLLLEPLELGVHERAGLSVWMVDSREVIETFATRHRALLDEGVEPWPTRPVLDFRWTRKPFMPQVYRATISRGAVR